MNTTTTKMAAAITALPLATPPHAATYYVDLNRVNDKGGARDEK